MVYAIPLSLVRFDDLNTLNCSRFDATNPYFLNLCVQLTPPIYRARPSPSFGDLTINTDSNYSCTVLNILGTR